MMRRSRMMRRLATAPDAGVTVTELLVAMGLMGVASAVFMTGVTAMSNGVVTQANLSDATDGNRVATQFFDRHEAFFTNAAGTAVSEQLGLRDADAIENPGIVAKTDGNGSEDYVEWHTTSSSVLSSCVQVRYDSETNLLQWRKATLDTSAGGSTVNRTAWSTLATNVVNALTVVNGVPANPVFTLTAPSSTAQAAQQLTLVIASKRGTANAGTQTTSVTFTADNSVGRAAPATNVCTATSGSPAFSLTRDPA
jgi:type II secretory pathway pseudopilin PulG